MVHIGYNVRFQGAKSDLNWCRGTEVLAFPYNSISMLHSQFIYQSTWMTYMILEVSSAGPLRNCMRFPTRGNRYGYMGDFEMPML